MIQKKGLRIGSYSPIKDENDIIGRYIDYHLQNAIQMEIDTHLDAARFLADKLNMTLDQRYWFSFLLACCEVPPTALYIFRRFKTMPNPEDFKLFIEAHRGQFKFSYDVSWIVYDWSNVYKSYLKLLNGRKASMVIPKAMSGETAAERFDNFLNNFHIHKFGRYVMFLYTELLYYLCGCPYTVKLDFSTNHSVRNGLVFAIGEDKNGLSIKGERINPAYIQHLQAKFYEVYRRIQKLPISDRHKTLWAVETSLCTYNKYNHGRRYLGYYCEIQRQEIFYFQSQMGEDESIFWEYRKSVFPKENLKELKNK